MLLAAPSYPKPQHAPPFTGATLVFFSYGSQLQIGIALLLCVGRLALHAQFEPYRMTFDNVFDYVTLVITALFGLGGIMLQVRVHAGTHTA